MSEAPRCPLCGHERELISGACVPCIDRLGSLVAMRRAWIARGELFTIDRLSKALGERVVGHEQARRTLIASLREHHLRARTPLPGRAARILLIGPPGCGKTTLGSALTDLWPGPSLHTDAGRLASASDPGECIEQLLGELVRLAGDPIAAARGVVFIDGLDASQPERFLSVQRELLRLLEGRSCEVQQGWRGGQMEGTAKVATSGILVAVAITGSPIPMLDAFRARFDRVIEVAPLSDGEREQVLLRTLNQARTLLDGARIGLIVDDEAARILLDATSEDGTGWALGRIARSLIEEALSGDADLHVDRALAQRLVNR